MSASASSVPSITFDSTGVTLPTDADILTGVQSDQNTAFGGGLNLALETPQGQIASSETAIISEKNSEIAYVCNQVDPRYASGRFQDAIGYIYFMTRQPATYTQVTTNITGVVAAIAPTGMLAKDTSGNVYALLAQVTIDSTGTTAGVFANVASGPIACPSGTLTNLYQAVDGIDSISNPTDGTLGVDVESRSEFEYRRQNSVASNAHGTTEAIYGNIFGVNGVSDCYCYDNASGATVNYGATNYPLAPHSLYVAAEGGTDADVATAIWKKKDTGCSYSAWPNWPIGAIVPGYGTVTSVTVNDSSDYSYPFPTYMVSFVRPVDTPILFAISVLNSSALPSNIVSLIQAAVIARFNGTDSVTDSSQERIGGRVSATRYYTSIAGVASNVIVLGVLVGISSATNMSVLMGIDQVPTITASNIAVNLVTE